MAPNVGHSFRLQLPRRALTLSIGPCMLPYSDLINFLSYYDYIIVAAVVIIIAVFTIFNIFIIAF